MPNTALLNKKFEDRIQVTFRGIFRKSRMTHGDQLPTPTTPDSNIPAPTPTRGQLSAGDKLIRRLLLAAILALIAGAARFAIPRLFPALRDTSLTLPNLTKDLHAAIRQTALTTSNPDGSQTTTLKSLLDRFEIKIHTRARDVTSASATLRASSSDLTAFKAAKSSGTLGPNLPLNDFDRQQVQNFIRNACPFESNEQAAQWIDQAVLHFEKSLTAPPLVHPFPDRTLTTIYDAKGQFLQFDIVPH